MSVISLSFLRIVFYSLQIRILQEKRRRFRQKAPDKQEIKISDSYRDKMQALKRQHLTRETVRACPRGTLT